MRNRAKCKICEEILESFHRHDYVTCKCGEISIDGGQDYWRCSAKDWSNFLRVDDNGNEFSPEIIEKEKNSSEEKPETKQSITKKDLHHECQSILDYIDKMDEYSKSKPEISILYSLSLIFKTFLEENI